jgi:hypothetical protein
VFWDNIQIANETLPMGVLFVNLKGRETHAKNTYFRLIYKGESSRFLHSFPFYPQITMHTYTNSGGLDIVTSKIYIIHYIVKTALADLAQDLQKIRKVFNAHFDTALKSRELI